jgi:hypothetical protein
MAKRKTIAEHAAEHLREHGHPGIMYGDVHLAHEICERAGRPHRGWKTPNLILNALEGSPLFKKKLVLLPGSVRGYRFFDLVR